MVKKYVSTLNELSAALSISRQTIFKWQHQTDFPPKTKAGKYNVIKIGEYIKDKQTKAQKNQEGPNADLRRQKLVLENAILQEKLDRLRGNSISVLEYQEELMAYSVIVNKVFNQFVTETKLLNNKNLLKQAERLRDMSRLEISDNLKLLEDKTDKVKE